MGKQLRTRHSNEGISVGNSQLNEILENNVSNTWYNGSPAFVVLSNKEKAARAGLIRQRTPPQCVMDDFLGEAFLNAVLRWFLGGSTQCF